MENKTKMQKPFSITHLHLLSVIRSEIRKIDFIHPEPIRILEAGCGEGVLMCYLVQSLSELNPDVKFEIYGFEVHDAGWSRNSLNDAIKSLRDKLPNIPWEDRYTYIPVKEAWTYPREYFDIVLSNQVLEHVHDPAKFFAEIYNVLRCGGCSIHLFPLKNYVLEGHFFIPFLHRILNYDLMVSYIKLASRVGIGSFRRINKEYGVTLDEYAESRADRMCLNTNYMSGAEALKLAKTSGFRASWRYTQEFYYSKLRSVFKRDTIFEYKFPRSAVCDWITFMLFRYISCVTLVMEKSLRKGASPKEA
jgi:SAM-dependent methyltransferase